MDAAERFYHKAKKAVKNAGYLWEITWQENLLFSDFTESDFLREYAWVVLCSGFKESVLRRKFDYISMCFCDWVSANEITESYMHCISTALLAFNNQRKIFAIANTARTISAMGFKKFSETISPDPIRSFQNLPQIGAVTAAHLAKNLGFPVAKADRHLVNLCKNYNSNNVGSFCEDLSNITGDSVQVVDIVLWRYMVLTSKKSESKN